MKLYNILGLIFFLLTFGCTKNNESNKTNKEGKGDKKNDKPNIIILFADDLGYGDLSCYGHPTISTPNIDKLASEGMRFTQFYVSSSLSSPSRGALLTGRLPVRTGLYGLKNHVFFCNAKGGIPDSEITLPQALKKQGYKSACIGKWHLGHQKQYLPTSKGFDYFYGLPYSNDMSPATNTWDGVKDCRPLPLMRGFDILENEPNQDSLTIKYTNEALKFIEAQKKNSFFLYLPYTFPHTPLHVSKKFANTSKRGLYGDVVSELDWSVGEIVDFLKKNDLHKNTIIFFTSDNGPWLMRKQHGGSAGLLKEGKGSTWEGGIRVPCIAWWPGKIKAGSIEPTVTSTMDLFVTALNLAGCQLPDDRIYDGVNISSVLFGKTQDVKNPLFFYKGEELYTVREGKWKMHLKTITEPFGKKKIEIHEPPLLFNLEEDPSENYNLSNKYPQVVDKLKTLIINHEKNLKMPEPEFDK